MKKFISFLTVAILLIIAGLFFTNNEDKRQQYALSIQEELKAFQNQLSKEVTDEKALGQPDMAALQDYYQTMDPLERRVPQERLVMARKQMKEMQVQSSFKSTQAIEWQNIPSNMGGRTRSLMWDPNSTSGNKVWAGSVTGGIWYNNDITDPSSVWIPVDDFMASLSISSLIFDPNNTTTFYAGTGEAPTALVTYRESSGRGVGILKSDDGGVSWYLLESTQDFAYITDIEIRVEDGISVIYAGVGSGVYKGVDHNSDPSDGLYRSADGGSSWEQVLPLISGLSTPYMPASIEIGADGRIFVGTMRNINGNGGGCLLYSDEGTEGSWTLNQDYKEQIEAGIGQYYLPGRVMFSPALSNENVVYALIGAGYENGFGFYHGNFILRSDDKGESWNELNIPDNDPTWASLSWHAFVISVDPMDEDHFYIGGLDVYHSLNSGLTYNRVSDWVLMYYGGGDQYIHGDIHAIEFKPGSSDEIIYATDGGVFYTDNGTNSFPDFQEKNNEYSSLQFYTCAIHPVQGEEEYLGGLQDNGTLRYTGDILDINDMISGGDGAFCLYNKYYPEIFVTSVYYNRYYMFYDGELVNLFNDFESGTFVSPAVLDNDDNILYANGVGFFGQNSNQIFRASGLPFSVDADLVNINTGLNTWFTAIASSPYAAANESKLFIGSNDGHLFRLDNAQSSPQSTEIGSEDFPIGSVSCIAIGASEDTLLVTFSNYGVSSVWKTNDGGENWMEVEGNLPDMPVRWALLHPQNNNIAMIATELGIWVTYDLSAGEVSWSPQINGMANVRIDQLDMRENDLTVLAASHGRGLFTTVFDITDVGTKDIEELNGFEIYPNPSNGQFTIDLNMVSEQVSEVAIYDMKAQLIYQNKTPKDKIFVNISNFSKGNYVLRVKTSFSIYAKKILIR
jgi:hypothetical protein